MDFRCCLILSYFSTGSPANHPAGELEPCGSYGFLTVAAESGIRPIRVTEGVSSLSETQPIKENKELIPCALIVHNVLLGRGARDFRCALVQISPRSLPRDR